MTIDLLACPACRRSLESGGGNWHCACGQLAERRGAVWSFLPPDSQALTAEQCVACAAWLIESGSEVRAAYQESQAAGNEEAFERFLRGSLPAAVSLDDFRAVQRRLPFAQVLNDLGDYSGDASGAADSDMREFMRGELDLKAGDILVDAGCSTGRNFLDTPAEVRCVGLDLTSEALQIGSQWWQAHGGNRSAVFCAANILQMPLASEACSHIQSFVVLGLVPIDLALREMHRVLRPGGRLAFTIEGPGFLRECWDQAPAWSYRRLALTRWHAGRLLIEAGLRWQKYRVMRRLAGAIQYKPQSIRKEVERAGFAVDTVSVLREYRGTPRLIGISAHKQAASR